MVLEYFIPDSPGDVGAILLWALLIVLVILIIVDLRIYLQYRKTPKKTEPGQPSTTDQIKQSKEDALEFEDVRNKVDRLLEIHKL
jgi:uncharacterized membrane protein affecting hemolysin expression